MGTPRQVTEAGEKAEEILKKITDPKEEQDDKPQGEEPEVATEATEDHEPKAVESDSGVESVSDSEDSRREEAAPKQDFEHKFKVLQGKYNAEVPRLQQHLKQMTEERDTLIRRMTALEEKMNKEPEEKPEEKGFDPSKFGLSKEEVDDYGEDFFDVVRRVVRAELNEGIAPVKNLESSVESLTARQREVEKERFVQSLSSAVPGWEKIDNDPRFLDWLKQADPLTGYVRQEILNRAVATFDVNRVANFFNTWKREAGVAQPQGKTDKAKGLEKRVVPETRGQNTPPPSGSSDGKEIVSRDFIAQFYNNRAKGLYRGREKEEHAIEQKINQAIRENRVR